MFKSLLKWTQVSKTDIFKSNTAIPKFFEKINDNDEERGSGSSSR